MSGRKYIGIVVFDQNIDQYSKSKKDSLKREIYEKMVGNQYFIKNIELGGGHFLSHKNKTIKLKGDKAIVEFKETVSPFNDTYKKKNKDKSMFNWAQKNFKRSMNFNKKMFLDDSLKAVKVQVKKDNKTKKRTRKHKKNMNGGVPPILMGVGGLTALGAAGAYGYKRYKDKKRLKGYSGKLLEGVSDKGFTVGEGPDFIPMEGDGSGGWRKQLDKIINTYGDDYEFRINDIQGQGFYKKNSPRQNNTFYGIVKPLDVDKSFASNQAMESAR